jgi:nucleoside 2-deoxyribosyltransferase
MNIYFAGSIRGGREDVLHYEGIIQYLRSFGTVLTEHVGDTALTETGDDGPDDRFIHERDMAWLRDCDLVIAEVTVPSLGVGYELGWACALQKPVLALYRPDQGKRLSAMIAGNTKNIVTAEYVDAVAAKAAIRDFIAKTEHQD